MIVSASVSKPQEVELTLTVRMTVAQWARVIEGLPTDYGNNWYASNFRGNVEKAINDVEYKALKIVREDEQ